MLIVHHLGRSQSERIVWLCEELGVPFELKRYERDPATVLAPPEYKALHLLVPPAHRRATRTGGPCGRATRTWPPS